MHLKQGSCTELKIDRNKVFTVLFFFIFFSEMCPSKKIVVAGELPLNLSSSALGLRRNRGVLGFFFKEAEGI